MDREVNKHGRAGWQGNEISSKEAFRGRFDREVNKKIETFAPSLATLQSSVRVLLMVPTHRWHRGLAKRINQGSLGVGTATI